MRAIFVVLLVGCGGDDGGSGGAAAECDPHPNGAPCCPRDVVITQADCPPETALTVSGADDPTGNTVTACHGTTGPVSGAPYTSINNETGLPVATLAPDESVLRLCWYSTGYQRGIGVPTAPGVYCHRECFGEDGAPVTCGEEPSTRPACP